MKTTAVALAAVLAVLCAAGGTLALTEEQCLFFEVNGKTAICHAIGSPQTPFIALEVPTQACMRHAEHPNDHVAVGDPECQGTGCLPENAPCDATLPCCEGLTCNNGICGPPLEDVMAEDGKACVQGRTAAAAP